MKSNSNFKPRQITGLRLVILLLLGTLFSGNVSSNIYPEYLLATDISQLVNSELGEEENNSLKVATRINKKSSAALTNELDHNNSNLTLSNNNLSIQREVMYAPSAASEDVIWHEDFSFTKMDHTNGHAGDKRIDVGITAWSTYSFNNSGLRFWVSDAKDFIGNNLGKEAVWTSEIIDISAYSDIGLSLKLREEGAMESTDYIKVYYKLNEGPRVLLNNGSFTGDFTPKTATASNLNGQNVQFVVVMRNGASHEYHRIDDVMVTGTKKSDNTDFFWRENFNDLSDGTNSDNGSSSWSINTADFGRDHGDFEVIHKRFESFDNHGMGIWETESINISNMEDVSISLDMFGFGIFSNNNDFIKAYYQLNNGSLQQLSNGSIIGQNDYKKATATNINGNNLKVIIKSTSNNWNKRFTFDNVIIKGKEKNSDPIPPLPDNRIWHEDFSFTKMDHLNGHIGDKRIDVGITAWSTFSFDNTGLRFWVSGAKDFIGNNLDKEAIWKSEIIDISAHTNIGLYLRLKSEGGLEPVDYVKVYYKLDEGPEILFDNGSFTGHFSPKAVTVNNLEGRNVQIVVRMKNTASDEYYRFDDVVVSGIEKPDNTDFYWRENFNDLPDGTQSDNGSSGWSINKAGFSEDHGDFEVINKRFESFDNHGMGIWETESINIFNLENVSISLDMYGFGIFSNNNDYITAYYQLNNGSLQQLSNGSIIGQNDYKRATASGLNGNSLKLIIKSTSNNWNKRFTFDNIVVKGTEVSNPKLLVWYEDFAGWADHTKEDFDYSGWTRSFITPTGNNSESSSTSDKTWAVTKQERFEVRQSIDEVKWVTEHINIKYYQGVAIDIDLHAEGDMENADYLKVYYNVNGGPEIPLQNGIKYNNFGTAHASAQNIEGDYLQIIARVRNSGTDEKYHLDNINVTGEEFVEPENAVWFETFNELNDESTSDAGTTTWQLNTDDAQLNGYLEVGQNRLVGNNFDGVVEWLSEEIDISSYASIDVAVDLYGYGFLEDDDQIRAYYKIDGGPLYLLDNGEHINDFSAPEVAFKKGLVGSKLQIVAKANNQTPKERYSIDNVLVKGSGAAQPLEIEAVGGELTCTNEKININVTTSISQVTYKWTGPGGFLSTLKSPEVVIPGDYVVTVTTTGSNETKVDTAIVTEDKNIPDLRTTKATDLSCSVIGLSIHAISSVSITELNHLWTGPAGYTSTSSSPTINQAGLYKIKITKIHSGCSNTDSIMVYKDDTIPDLEVVGGVLSCVNDSVALTAISSDEIFFYTWTGPGGFSSSESSPVVTNPGTYSVTITALKNGCRNTGSVEVTGSTSVPSLNISKSGDINCNADPVLLTATSSTNGIKFNWNGFTEGANPIQVNRAGYYVVTALDTTNMCSTIDSIKVDQTNEGLEINLTGGRLTCDITTVTLTSGTNAVNPQFSWVGPDGYSSSLQNPEVNKPGTYTLTITDQSTGCTGNKSVEVRIDTIRPDVTVAGGELDCIVSSLTIKASSTVPNVTYNWTGPGGFNSQLAEPVVNLSGLYQVSVSNPDNGCYNSASTFVSIDTIKPNLSVTGASLSCKDPKLPISASSTVPGVTYSWVGPGSFSSTLPSPEVEKAGTYTVTISNPANGCTNSKSTSVSIDTATPDLTVSGAVLTCTNPKLPISASSTVPGVTYGWVGPGSFSSTLPSPEVENAGTYTVTISNPANGCTNSKSVGVTKDADIPDLSVSGAALTCADPKLPISASSTVPGVTYSWDGPGSFSSTLPSPEVENAGTYTVTITNPANGCTNSKSTSVSIDTATPDLSVSGAVLTCTNPKLPISASSTVPGVTYSWVGPGGFGSPIASPEVENAGTYTVTISNPANGCTNSKSTSVSIDTATPDLSVSGAALTCTDPKLPISASSTVSGVTYSWVGPGSFSSTLPSPEVENAGTYTVTITNPANGCTNSKSVGVTKDADIPDLSVSGAALTCTNPKLPISASSTVPGVTYSWVGPGSFSSTLPSPEVEKAGTYTVTISNPANGCTNSKSTSVSIDTTTPDLSVSGAALTCTDPKLPISASSTVPGVTYSWVGPGSFGSPIASPEVEKAGTYTVTISNPANGCINSKSTSVSIDTTTPDLSVSGAALTCTDPKLPINASSTVPGVTYSWVGPGSFSSTLPSPEVEKAGTYTVTISNPANGCTNSKSTSVSIDTATPDLSVSGAALTCTDPKLPISASSTVSGVSYSWVGPGSFSSTLPSPEVENAGTYTVTISNPANGCTNSKSTSVSIDTATPDLSVSGAALTCTNPKLPISASSTVPGVTYSWVGPGSFSSTLPSPEVEEAGTYTVTISNPVNGCTNSKSTSVSIDTATPDLSVSGAALTCTNPKLPISASSTVPGVTYSWVGPGGFGSPIASPEVENAGTYTVTISNPANGCTNSKSTSVSIDTATPDLSVSGAALTCTDPKLPISASSTVSGVTYSWVGPGSFSSTLPSPEVENAGTYTVTITNPANGCTNSKSVGVTKDADIPDLSVSGAALTCTNPKLPISASSTVPGVTYSWVGPGSFSSTLPSPEVEKAGTYTVTISNPANGCTNSKSTSVSIDTTTPDLSLSGAALTCTDPKLPISASSTVPGVTYSWVGPGGFGSPIASPEVENAGTYTVTISNPANGCTNSKSTTVSIDTTTPDLSVSGAALTCTDPKLPINASSTVPGVTYSWVGPGSFSSTLPSPEVEKAGTYTVTITDPANGCTNSRSTSVSIDTATPDLSLSGAALSCKDPKLPINASSTVPGVTYSWVGPGSFSSTLPSPEVENAGTYTVTISNPANGCTNSKSTTVSIDTATPNLSVSGAALTCTDPKLPINASSTVPGVTYSWVGPGSFSSTLPSPEVEKAGTYTVTISNPANGCTNSKSTSVSIDTTTPDLSVSGAALTCTNPKLPISASSTVSGVTYSWVGPGSFGSPIASPEVEHAGTYTVTISNPANGCTNSKSTTVSIDTVTPNLTVFGATLTCTNPKLPISASSTVSDVTYSWIGPGSFGSTLPSPEVEKAGTYNVTITNPSNGCTNSEDVIVEQDTVTPDISTTADGVRTCGNTNITLTATTSSTRSDIQWEGFALNDNPVVITIPRKYVTVITDRVNGCTNSDTLSVEHDTISPSLNITGGTITCNNDQVQLDAGTDITNGIYRWTGPFFSSSEEKPFVEEAGTYFLELRNAANGCISNGSVEVLEDGFAPECKINEPDSPPVAGSVDSLSAVESPNTSYTWSISGDPSGEWSILSGQGTSKITYSVGQTAGSKVKFNLQTISDITGCGGICILEVTSAAAEQSVQGNRMPALTNVLHPEPEIISYPNPFNDNLRLTFTSEEGSHVKVELRDISGRLIEVVFDRITESTSTTIDFDSYKLSFGIYYLVYNNGKVVLTEKIVKK